MCRWDLVKRVPKEILDYLAEKAKASVLDDNTVQSDYVACQEWLRCGLSHCVSGCKCCSTAVTALFSWQYRYRYCFDVIL